MTFELFKQIVTNLINNKSSLPEPKNLSHIFKTEKYA